MIRFYLSLGLFLLNGYVLFGQKLTGSIIDGRNGESLIGANLYVKSDWRKGTSTDIHGKFTLNNIKQGDTLVISYIGYKELFHIVTEIRPLDIALQPNTLNMDVIVVTAEKLAAEEFTYKRISRLDVYLNPSAKADPLLAVNSVPAATTLDESANISFRGSSPAETGLFFNNVPLYDAIRFSQLNGIGTFSVFNTAMVNEMLVFPGNPPLEYGNTTSGLIAIQTSEEIRETTSNSVTLSPASYGGLAQRSTSKKSALTLFSNYQPSSIIKALNPEALDDIQKFQSVDLGINFLNHFNDHTILKVFNYTLTEGYDFSYQSPTFQGTFKQRKQRNFTVTNFRHKVNRSEWSLNSNISFSKAEFGYADTDITIHNFDAFFSANYRYQRENFYAKTGLSVDHRKQKFTGTYYAFDFAEGDGFPTTSNHNTVRLNRPELYVYTKYYWGKKIILGGGLRKNIPATLRDHYLSMQLNTRIQLNTHAHITMAWGKYHKYSLPQNDIENPFLIASDQLSADLNWNQNDLEFSTSIFGKKNRQLNRTTELFGLEFFLKGKILPKLRGQLSYTLINGNTREAGGERYPAEYDLNYFIRGNLEYKFTRGWTASANFILRDGRHYQPLINITFHEGLSVFEPEYAPLTQQKRLRSYKGFDLSISKLIAVSEKFSIIVFGSASNVLDIKNLRSYTYNFDYSVRQAQYFSRRTFYFGMVIHF
ncbi:TonB-dependent receptor [Fulvivirga sp. M361]|uniref:TonB-dependent receptor n=1 Tax=Fulvivirga sp. M361 TaxID=2594266 RepID=UPI00117AC178|nr:TonB-dependent receptor [Fulvivirga sp. M361]TRX52390.1 TonB-dependent receptor [Fulvivirga sp. M361]